MKSLTLLALLLFPGILLGQGPIQHAIDDAKRDAAIQQAIEAAMKINVPSKAQPPAAPPQKKRWVQQYEQSHARAQREHKPLVVWVGVNRPDVEKVLSNCVHFHTDEFFYVSGRAVVVGHWAGKEFLRIDLPATAGVWDILHAAGQGNAVPQAVPQKPLLGGNCWGGS